MLLIFLTMRNEFKHRAHAEAHSLETSVLQTLFEALCCDSAELCSLHEKKQRMYKDCGHYCSYSCSHISHFLPSSLTCQSAPRNLLCQVSLLLFQLLNLFQKHRLVTQRAQISWDSILSYLIPWVLLNTNIATRCGAIRTEHWASSWH